MEKFLSDSGEKFRNWLSFWPENLEKHYLIFSKWSSEAPPWKLQLGHFAPAFLIAASSPKQFLHPTSFHLPNLIGARFSGNLQPISILLLLESTSVPKSHSHSLFHIAPPHPLDLLHILLAPALLIFFLLYPHYNPSALNSRLITPIHFYPIRTAVPGLGIALRRVQLETTWGFWAAKRERRLWFC